MVTIPYQILEDIKNYETNIFKYISGELDIKEFKPYGAAMGVYAERNGSTYMVRPRIPSGVITLHELKHISQIAKEFSNSKIHFTTRQDIQFHGVPFENTPKLMKELLKINLISRGTGGNTARNVSCSPLSGVEKNEIFDVTPFALAVGEFLLKDPNNFTLPRKYKIGFSNNEKDEGHAKISDLGFVATRNKNNIEGFRLYGGGGLGGRAKPSIIIKEFIKKNEVIFHVQAMKLLFEKHGDRKNKSLARIRHIVRRFGEEKFIEEYDKFYKLSKQDTKINNFELKKYLDIFSSIKLLENGKENFEKISDNITESKTKNRYSVYFQPENGNITSTELDKLISVLETLKYEFSIRLSLAQGILIRNIDGKDVSRLINAGKSFYSESTIEKSTACSGAAICQLGICRSQGLSSAIKQEFNDSKKYKKLKNALPKIYISGCPNSCGQHQIGEIGFYGKAKKENENLLPVYTLVLGGNLNLKVAKFGNEFGTLPAKAIPIFLKKLAQLKDELSPDTSFQFFLTNEEKAVKFLIDKYSIIPSIENKPDYYKDFGKDDFFSLKK